MSHSLAWVYEVSGLRPASAFCFDGKSEVGVDYYDAAAVRCVSGATISLSGAATIPGHVATADPDGHGFHLDVRIFGSEGVLSFDIERERLEVRRRDGTDTFVPIEHGEGGYQCTEPVARFVRICGGEPSAEVGNSCSGDVGCAVVETLDAMYRSAASGSLETV